MKAVIKNTLLLFTILTGTLSFAEESKDVAKEMEEFETKPQAGRAPASVDVEYDEMMQFENELEKKVQDLKQKSN